MIEGRLAEKFRDLVFVALIMSVDPNLITGTS